MSASRARSICAVVAAGALIAGCSVARPGRPTVPSVPSGGPQIAAPRLASLLLSDDQIRSLMSAPTMVVDKTYGELEDDRSVDYSVGEPICVTALWNAIAQSYRASGVQAVAGRVLHEPGDHFDHDLDQAVLLFKTADQARRHLDQSMVIWQRCATKRQHFQVEGYKPETWSVGIPATAGPDIVVRNSREAADGYVCQHVMRAAGNVLIDAWACGIDIVDQARTMVDDIAAKVQS